MIKAIDKNELLKSFFNVVIEVEFGNHFDKNEEQHQKILNHRINKHIANNAIIFGLYKNTNPIGFITVCKNVHLFHENDGEILEIGILNKYRGKGHGTQLIKYIESFFINDSTFAHIIFFNIRK